MEFFIEHDRLVYSRGSFNWTTITSKGKIKLLVPQSSTIKILEDQENTIICLPSHAEIIVQESTSKIVIKIPDQITEFVKIYVVKLHDSKIRLVRDYLPYFQTYLQLHNTTRDILISGYSKLRNQEKYFAGWIGLFTGNGLTVSYFDYDIRINYSY